MHKILYVEDEIFLAKIVTESLESRGFKVLHVSDGRLAIDVYKAHDIDICILDVMLPGKSGFELARDIRKVDRMVPILFLTAKEQAEDVLDGFNSGGNDYIKKPFSMEELLVRIKNLIQLTQIKLRDAVILEDISIGGVYTFSPSKMILNNGHEDIQLSHKENQIVHLLSNNQNRTILRQDILMQVWSDDSFYNSRNLDVYIRKLRNYFSKDENIQIVTLRGTGYRFMVD